MLSCLPLLDRLEILEDMLRSQDEDKQAEVAFFARKLFEKGVDVTPLTDGLLLALENRGIWNPLARLAVSGALGVDIRATIVWALGAYASYVCSARNDVAFWISNGHHYQPLREQAERTVEKIDDACR